MQFRDNGRVIENLPNWAYFLISFGYHFKRSNKSKRRIALISMPSESAAAGLISLGALIRDLEDPKANDTESHYRGLVRFARQYLDHCKDCVLESCDPAIQRCGCLMEASGILFKRSGRSSPRRYEIVEPPADLPDRELAVRKLNKSLTEYPNRKEAETWHIEHESPLHTLNSDGNLDGSIYREFLDVGSFKKENLMSSYSGTCLACDSSGAAKTKGKCDSLEFEIRDSIVSLSELLTVKSWSKTSISRLSSYNVRTKTFDRSSIYPDMLICDGDRAFLSTSDLPEFQRSDIVGVIDRTADRDRLELVGDKQWFIEDDFFTNEISELPLGINIAILVQR